MIRRATTTTLGLAAVFIVGGAVLLSASVCDPDKGSYLNANEKLMATLPVMDGASHTATESLPHRVDDGSRVAGYSSLWTYAVPGNVSASSVEQFYSAAMIEDGWTLHRNTVGCLRVDGAAPDAPATRAPDVPFPCDQDAVELGFRKGGVLVNVHLPVGAWVGQFTVALDHDYTDG